MRRHAVIGKHAPNWTRRACLGALVMLGLPSVTLAAPATLPSAKSLRDELALALKSGNPLVVMVSLDGCPYCTVVREQYLAPMRTEDKLSVVQVDMHSSVALQDFNGVDLSHTQWVRAWKVTLAPSVLFFGPGGAEVAARLVGVASPDYYGTKLEQRLAQARSAIKTG